MLQLLPPVLSSMCTGSANALRPLGYLRGALYTHSQRLSCPPKGTTTPLYRYSTCVYRDQEPEPVLADGLDEFVATPHMVQAL
jgi:hypothetical protein